MEAPLSDYHLFSLSSALIYLQGPHHDLLSHDVRRLPARRAHLPVPSGKL